MLLKGFSVRIEEIQTCQLVIGFETCYATITKIPVATNFFEASSLRHISQCALLTATHQPATIIENVYKFYDFYKALLSQGLWDGIFVDFGDNGHSGCRAVV